MVASGDAMTNYPYILFNQTPEDLRRIGARCGRAYGRNRRGLRHTDLPVTDWPKLAAQWMHSIGAIK
jgi:hypothetical protein